MNSIVIINQYSTTPDNGYGGRSFYISKYLVRLGYHVTLVQASHHHLSTNDDVQEKRFKCFNCDGINVVRVKTKPYVGSTSFTRVVNWFSFMFFVCFLKFKKYCKPDVIMYSSPSLPGIFSGYFLKKKYKSKLIFDVRDVWPMTLVTVGGVSKYHPLILILRVVEAFGYRFSDHITSNLPCFYKHIKDKEKFTWLPNGVDVDEITNPEPIPDSFYPNKKPGDFIVGYAGALGQVNSISILLEAAKELNNITDLFFYIVGDGKELDNLVQYANEHELCNVKFFPKVKKKQMPEILKEFDVCYLGWKNESLYEFGISPNKLPEYFFAKKPVLHSYSGAGDLVSNAQAGITIPAENLTELVNAIVSFKNMSPENLNLLGVNGYNFAVSNLSYAEISKSFSKLI